MGSVALQNASRSLIGSSASSNTGAAKSSPSAETRPSGRLIVTLTVKHAPFSPSASGCFNVEIELDGEVTERQVTRIIDRGWESGLVE